MSHRHYDINGPYAEHWANVSQATWEQVDAILASGGWHYDNRFVLVGCVERLDVRASGQPTAQHRDDLTGREWLATFGTIVHPDGSVTQQ